MRYNSKGSPVSANINSNRDWELIEATVDSGACATVSGKETASAFPIRDPDKAQNFKAANKSEIKNHGRRDIWGVSSDGVKINFATNVADVDGMLIALNAIVDSGNEVSFRFKDKGGLTSNMR